MRTLNKSHEQLGGNSELYITPISNIISIDGNFVSLSFSVLLLQIVASRDSIRHIVTSKKTSSGKLYTHSLTAKVLYRSDENDKLLDYFQTYKLFAFYKDSEGLFHAIGSMDIGLAMDWQHDTGADPSSYIGYDISFQGNLSTNSFIIDFPVIQ